MERVNLRHLKSLPEQVDIATLDVSFISLLKVSIGLALLRCIPDVSRSPQVLPAVRAVLRPRGRLVVLIKPQFEALRGEVRYHGSIVLARLH